MSEEKSLSIEQIIEAWLAKFGSKDNYKEGINFFRVRTKDFAATFRPLLTGLLKCGYTEDEVRGRYFMSRLQAALIPPDWKSKKLKKEWVDKRKEAAETQWGFQLQAKFGEDRKDIIGEANFEAPDSKRPKLPDELVGKQTEPVEEISIFDE
jgi:hypothetical protein